MPHLRCHPYGGLKMPAFPPAHPMVLPTKPPSRGAPEDVSPSPRWWQMAARHRRPVTSQEPSPACACPLPSRRPPVRAGCPGPRGAEGRAGAGWGPGNSSLASRPRWEPWGSVNEALYPILQTMKPPSQRRSQGTEQGARATSALTWAVGVTGDRLRNWGTGRPFRAAPGFRAPRFRSGTGHRRAAPAEACGAGRWGSFGSNRNSIVELKRLRSPPNPKGSLQPEENQNFIRGWVAAWVASWLASPAGPMPLFGRSPSGAWSPRGQRESNCKLFPLTCHLIKHDDRNRETAFFRLPNLPTSPAFSCGDIPPELCRVALHALHDWTSQVCF